MVTGGRGKTGDNLNVQCREIIQSLGNGYNSGRLLNTVREKWKHTSYPRIQQWQNGDPKN